MTISATKSRFEELEENKTNLQKNAFSSKFELNKKIIKVFIEKNKEINPKNKQTLFEKKKIEKKKPNKKTPHQI